MNIHLYPFTGCFGAHRGTLVLTSTHVHIYKYFFFAILQPEANPAAAACKVPALSSVVGTDCRNIYMSLLPQLFFFPSTPHQAHLWPQARRIHQDIGVLIVHRDGWNDGQAGSLEELQAVMAIDHHVLHDPRLARCPVNVGLL